MCIRDSFNGEIGYLRLSSFQSNSTTNVRDAIYKLRKDTGKLMSALILDLRNNPGGVLGAAVGISDLFLESGKIVYTKGRTNNSDLEYFANSEDILEGLPLYVLINGGSASASEIVAGALQDHNRALVVGTRSFGKGSVQSILPMANGTAIKLTTARYFTPNGRSIQAKGIDPDIIIEDGNENIPVMREADLTNRLSNPEESDANATKDESKPTSDGGEALRNFKPIELGGDEDKQFAEAVKILKDIDRYHKKN
mgnify:CR=1 FL=1